MKTTLVALALATSASGFHAPSGLGPSQLSGSSARAKQCSAPLHMRRAAARSSLSMTESDDDAATKKQAVPAVNGVAKAEKAAVAEKEKPEAIAEAPKAVKVDTPPSTRPKVTVSSSNSNNKVDKVDKNKPKTQGKNAVQNYIASLNPFQYMEVIDTSKQSQSTPSTTANKKTVNKVDAGVASDNIIKPANIKDTDKDKDKVTKSSSSSSIDKNMDDNDNDDIKTKVKKATDDVSEKAEKSVDAIKEKTDKVEKKASDIGNDIADEAKSIKKKVIDTDNDVIDDTKKSIKNVAKSIEKSTDETAEIKDKVAVKKSSDRPKVSARVDTDNDDNDDDDDKEKKNIKASINKTVVNDDNRDISIKSNKVISSDSSTDAIKKATSSTTPASQQQTPIAPKTKITPNASAVKPQQQESKPPKLDVANVMNAEAVEKRRKEAADAKLQQQQQQQASSSSDKKKATTTTSNDKKIDVKDDTNGSSGGGIFSVISNIFSTKGPSAIRDPKIDPTARGMLSKAKGDYTGKSLPILTDKDKDNINKLIEERGGVLNEVFFKEQWLLLEQEAKDKAIAEAAKKQGTKKPTVIAESIVKDIKDDNVDVSSSIKKASLSPVAVVTDNKTKTSSSSSAKPPATTDNNTNTNSSGGFLSGLFKAVTDINGKKDNDNNVEAKDTIKTSNSIPKVSLQQQQNKDDVNDNDNVTNVSVRPKLPSAATSMIEKAVEKVEKPSTINTDINTNSNKDEGFMGMVSGLFGGNKADTDKIEKPKTPLSSSSSPVSSIDKKEQSDTTINTSFKAQPRTPATTNKQQQQQQQSDSVSNSNNGLFASMFGQSVYDDETNTLPPSKRDLNTQQSQSQSQSRGSDIDSVTVTSTKPDTVVKSIDKSTSTEKSNDNSNSGGLFGMFGGNKKDTTVQKDNKIKSTVSSTINIPSSSSSSRPNINTPSVQQQQANNKITDVKDTTGKKDSYNDDNVPKNSGGIFSMFNNNKGKKDEKQLEKKQNQQIKQLQQQTSSLNLDNTKKLTDNDNQSSSGIGGLFSSLLSNNKPVIKEKQQPTPITPAPITPSSTQSNNTSTSSRLLKPTLPSKKTSSPTVPNKLPIPTTSIKSIKSITSSNAIKAPRGRKMDDTFIKNISVLLKRDQTRIKQFQVSTDRYRGGLISSQAYYNTIEQLFGSDDIYDKVIQPLLNTMPEQDKRKSLQDVYEKATKTVNTSAAASSDNKPKFGGFFGFGGGNNNSNKASSSNDSSSSNTNVASNAVKPIMTTPTRSKATSTFTSTRSKQTTTSTPSSKTTNNSSDPLVFAQSKLTASDYDLFAKRTLLFKRGAINARNYYDSIVPIFSKGSNKGIDKSIVDNIVNALPPNKAKLFNDVYNGLQQQR